MIPLKQQGRQIFHLRTRGVVESGGSQGATEALPSEEKGVVHEEWGSQGGGRRSGEEHNACISNECYDSSPLFIRT